MSELSKQILNYFATFTETRFNFNRTIHYQWTDNELTLDLSLFPEFQQKLLEKVQTGDTGSLTVLPGQHVISLNKEDIVEELLKAIDENYNEEYLIAGVIKAQENASATMAVDEDGVAIQETLNVSSLILEDCSDVARKEGFRTYRIALRQQFENILVRQQQAFIEAKRQELNITNIPKSIFGMTNYLEEHTQAWEQIQNNTSDPHEFLSHIKEHLKNTVKDAVLYDLFFNIQNYKDFLTLGTPYVFFHALESDSNSYPLYFFEVEFRTADHEVLISLPRNLALINTPAVNRFQFDSVLTTPRSSALSKLSSYLSGVETFIQAQYGFQTPFILELSFRTIIHDDADKPKVAPRIGFQTISNEDKKLLDYSELMMRLDMGEDSRFTDLVSQYVDGDIPNTIRDVAKEFKDQYPATSPDRYLTNVPIPLNDSQKRILIALTKPENRIMVVDGPPGTGKSHTIAALTYWANEAGKSVVVTSHKTEALDVIDRNLTDKFRELHPQGKPSIVRIDNGGNSENTLQNTMQGAVVSAAQNRTVNFNVEAVQADFERVKKELYEQMQERIDTSKQSTEQIRSLVAYEKLREKFASDDQLSGIVNHLSVVESDVLHVIDSLLEDDFFSKLPGMSLAEYVWISGLQKSLETFLQACEKLYAAPAGSLEVETALQSMPEDFKVLVDSLAAVLRTDVPIAQLTAKDSSAGFFDRVLGRAAPENERHALLEKVNTLQHSTVLREVASSAGKDASSVTLAELQDTLAKIEVKLSMARYERWITEYRSFPGNEQKGIQEIYETVRLHRDNLSLFDASTAESLQSFAETYPDSLEALNVTPVDLSTFSQLQTDRQAREVFDFLKLHNQLAEKQSQHSTQPRLVTEYYELLHKLVAHENDERLTHLSSNLMQKVQTSYRTSKRFSSEEARKLLKTISCIIASPAAMAKYLPMEEDLIDILIIDEASQVSIADSISLMLRAKQVVVFGDEYQYGAVSAMNVSAQYSRSYFSEIINAFSDEHQGLVPDEARQALIDEVSAEVDEDEAYSEEVARPDPAAPGAIEWLKTFNIRTSTLSFAKAMANYNTSLMEHFRSFPEIISYSNEYFYKPAQMELIVNRIRTKPISETLKFIRVETNGQMPPNTNLDEIDVIIEDIEERLVNGFQGTIGIITSLREQQVRMEQALNERLDYPRLKQTNKLSVWFVGDVQGEERDIIYYSFVEDQYRQNARLSSIYPTVGGTADSIRSLKMQRLNVGFSRAKDTMVFVHSQDIEKFANTRLGNALQHYKSVLEESAQNDLFIADETVFDSPMERQLYQLLMQTDFVEQNKHQLHIIPQFPIGKYLRAEFAAKVPEYRVDFLLTLNRDNGKTDTLILEYDGLEFHFKEPSEVPTGLLTQEYVDYDVQRQLELESYGYRFLRINYYTLLPKESGQSKADVLNELLEQHFNPRS